MNELRYEQLEWVQCSVLDQRMQCPFLKKINFKKVSQITSDDPSCQEPIEKFMQTHNQIVGFSQEDFSFCDEKIEIINSSQANKHDVYYFNTQINIPQSSNNRLEIKYPKQLQIKKMIYPNQLMEIDQVQTSESFISDCQINQSKNVPHILVSKMSMLTSKCENIFHGDIVLQDEPNNIYQCDIEDHNIRIYLSNRVKYFIELKNAQCSLQSIIGNCAVLIAKCKTNTLSLKIQFKSKNKIYSFLKALQLNYLEIDQQKQEENRTMNQNQSLSYSMDSLGFQVQRMDIRRLKEVGDTFDILLFKNKTLMSKVQRIFTNSDYDHIAMLLKTTSNQIFILQSSSNAGVAVYTLDSLIRLPRKKHYFRVGLRQYKAERKLGQIVLLQQFIRKTMGKKYKFDPMYLISSDVKKTDSTYFCSELISAALQYVGILDKTKPAYKYLPSN